MRREWPDLLEKGAEERRQALTAFLREVTTGTATSADILHDRCTEIAFYDYDVRAVLRELAPEPSPRLVNAARQLLTSENRRAVLIGLALLTGQARESDIPLLRTVGQHEFAAPQAVRALLAIPGAQTDAIWIADRVPGVRGEVGGALSGHPDPDVCRWACRNSSGYMRHVRERAGKHDLRVQLLDRAHVDDESWDRMGKRLYDMCHNDLSSEFGYYQHDTTALRRWVALASTRPATVDRAVLLCSLAEELVSGHAAVVVRDLRDGLLGEIRRVLSRWSSVLEDQAADDGRAAWVLRESPGLRVPSKRFAVRIATRAPEPTGGVEARILLDREPICAALFGGGFSGWPEWVVDGGRLLATDEPREVLLDDHDGTDLYVTIVREGAEVVWKDWRWTRHSDRLPGEFRFDAEEYDREVALAEADRSWEWPARTVARLVEQRLRADPSILGRWDCGPGHCHSSRDVHDAAVLDFRYPAGASWDEPAVTFRHGIDVAGRDPVEVADDVIAMLCASDPKKTVGMVGVDSAATAERLGLLHRRSTVTYR
ncbi:hypothetical protein [Lentzea jiangxiensis]|uniref:Uncharacterized protein n=1 Tax=Lentzea jiangxiensis TaxID=641025 RepID=A0A1H0PPA9_9PSEU|nr:hypothetical protein [Lentzea jiangxiensis]SDP06824.1 hypothetical protein SAMN05421507_105145 [Lentzea jiangxiensis]